MAEIAEIDGRRLAQPLRGYLSIVLTLREFFFYRTLVCIALTQA